MKKTDNQAPEKRNVLFNEYNHLTKDQLIEQLIQQKSLCIDYEQYSRSKTKKIQELEEKIKTLTTPL